MAPGDQGEPHQVHHHVVKFLRLKDIVFLSQFLEIHSVLVFRSDGEVMILPDKTDRALTSQRI